MVRYSSNLSKTYRNMAFNWFRVFLGSETQLLLAYQLCQKGEWASKKLVMEIAFNMAKFAICARNWYCCTVCCCINWTCRTHKKVTAELTKQDSTEGFLLKWRSVPDTLWPIGWRWMPQCYRETLGDCPGSKMSLSILEFIYYPSVVFDRVKDR